MISHPGERPKSKFFTMPDNEGAITVPTIMVRLLTNNKVKIPRFVIFFMLQNCSYVRRTI